MSLGGRISIVFVTFAVAIAAVIYALTTFLTPQPATIDFTASHQPGAAVNLTVQTVPSIGFGNHPTWVSYLVKDLNGRWVHSTVWALPAHTLINVTIEQYDTGSALRNQLWGLVQGTHNGTESLNGTPISVYNSNTGNGVGHTFSIPTLGISVPLVGVSSNSSNVCSVAPCGHSFDHNTITFSFRTPGPGEYPWQCFVPCGLGYLYGNGGPMSTVGFMGGFLDVRA